MIVDSFKLALTKWQIVFKRCNFLKNIVNIETIMDQSWWIFYGKENLTTHPHPHKPTPTHIKHTHVSNAGWEIILFFLYFYCVHRFFRLAFKTTKVYIFCLSQFLNNRSFKLHFDRLFPPQFWVQFWTRMCCFVNFSLFTWTKTEYSSLILSSILSFVRRDFKQGFFTR